MSDTPKTDALDRKHNPWGNHYWCREQKEWKALCGEIERENGRLTALLRCHHDEPCTAIVLKQDAEIDELRAECERLRLALCEITVLDHTATRLTAKRIAREALATKEGA